MIVCRKHNATYPRNKHEDLCYGHIEKLEIMGSSTDICDPWWYVGKWVEEARTQPVEEVA